MYSLTSLKVGDPICWFIPKPSANPWVKVVFPDPKSPINAIIVPFFNFLENFDASKFSKKLKNGTIIALIGDLGSGKTTFTQGFAEGLGINQHIGSPTFKLVSEYTGLKWKLYHAW